MDPGEFERRGLLPKQSSDGRTSAKGRFVEGRENNMAVKCFGEKTHDFENMAISGAELVFHTSPNAPKNTKMLPNLHLRRSGNEKNTPSH